MLKRKVEKEIDRWLSGDDRALLVDGVRACGKTYIIRACLDRGNFDYVEFNLIKQPDVLNAFVTAADINQLVIQLELLADHRLTPHKTIIFLDEIQEYKEAVTKIKFLNEDKRYRYILSGSLLGVEITGVRSAPVSHLEILEMYPMDLMEFLQVYNVSDELIENLKECYEKRIPVDPVIHEKLMNLFRMYLLIGGMPQAVDKYLSTSQIDDVMDIHKSIEALYRLDFTKYEQENRKLILENIYDLIPAELNSENRRFHFADIRKNLRYERIADSFVWLWKAGVALPVYNTSEPSVPFSINENSSLFRLFLSDVGMLTTMYGKTTKAKILQKDSGMNAGAVYENFAAQELKSRGYDLYYYTGKKYGELDFLIEQSGSSLPIEIKNGRNFKKHAALDHVMEEKEKYGIKEAYVFADTNVSKEGNIVYLPLYMMMFLNEDDVPFPDISVEALSF